MGRSASSQADVRNTDTDVVRDGCVVIDISGIKHRPVACVNYHYGIAYVCFIGTHREHARKYAQNV